MVGLVWNFEFWVIGFLNLFGCACIYVGLCWWFALLRFTFRVLFVGFVVLMWFMFVGYCRSVLGFVNGCLIVVFWGFSVLVFMIRIFVRLWRFCVL